MPKEHCSRIAPILPDSTLRSPHHSQAEAHARSLSQAEAHAHTLSQEPTLAERSVRAGQLLATRFDHLNQMILVTEELFRSLKCPVTAYHHYNFPSQEEGNTAYCEVIGFGKVKDKWRIVHAYDCEANDGVPFDLQPLSDCPVEIRVRAATEIPKLYERIVEQKEKFVPAVEDAVAALIKFYTSVTNQEGE
jgi:hypothetical protein